MCSVGQNSFCIYLRPATGSPGDTVPAPLKEHVLPRNPTRCLLDGQVVMTLQQIHVGLRFHAGQSSVSDNVTLVVGLPLCPSDSTIVLRARSSVVEQPVCNRWVAGSIPAVVQTFLFVCLLFPHPCKHDIQHRLGSSLRRCKHHSKGRWSM